MVLPANPKLPHGMSVRCARSHAHLHAIASAGEWQRRGGAPRGGGARRASSKGEAPRGGGARRASSSPSARARGGQRAPAQSRGRWVGTRTSEADSDAFRQQLVVMKAASVEREATIEDLQARINGRAVTAGMAATNRQGRCRRKMRRRVPSSTSRFPRTRAHRWLTSRTPLPKVRCGRGRTSPWPCVGASLGSGRP